MLQGAEAGNAIHLFKISLTNSFQHPDYWKAQKDLPLMSLKQLFWPEGLNRFEFGLQVINEHTNLSISSDMFTKLFPLSSTVKAGQ